MSNEERLDRATSQRLGKLRTMPVETGRVGGRLARELGLNERGAGGRAYAVYRSLRAVAASVLVLVAVGLVLLYMTTAPVSASPSTMLKLHEDLVSGRTPVTKVESIEEAGKELASQWPEGPGLPAGVPAEHVMACCMKSVENKRVACVLMKGETAPVSMMVASASDVRTPRDGRQVVRDGRTYYVHAGDGGVNMVSTVQEGRYVCMIGAVPGERLVELAGRLRF